MKQFRFREFTAAASLLMIGLLACAGCGRLERTNLAPRDVRAVEAQFHINVNAAGVSELEQLPGVGKVIAERIVSYREQYGRFRRPEELLMVNGISDNKFRKIRAMIVVE